MEKMRATSNPGPPTAKKPLVTRRIIKRNETIDDVMKNEESRSSDSKLTEESKESSFTVSETAPTSADESVEVELLLPEERLDEGGEKESKTSQKSLDALFAAAREEFDLDMTPIDSAVKTMREGREIQKISVIRNFGDLIQSDAYSAIERVLPLIQANLAQDPSNLDIHCESSIVFKNLIKERKYFDHSPDLKEKMLYCILENIEVQKENVTAAAWLESLVDVTDFVPMQFVTDLILPLTFTQADPSKRVQRRIISTRLLEKLATILPKEYVQKELMPCVQMLCQDPSAQVRVSIAQRLSIVAQALNNSTECGNLLLPCLVELCKDDDLCVREAILNTLGICLPYFTKENQKTVIMPLVRKLVEQSLILRDVSLSVIARQLGPWLQCLKDVLSESDRNWFLDSYSRILEYAWKQQEKQSQEDRATEDTMDRTSPTGEKSANYGGKYHSSALSTNCRRMCAYNFPCFASVFGNNRELFNKRLLPVLETLCKDPDEEVRSTIASGFHEIVQIRLTASTEKLKDSDDDQLLLGPFVELLSSGTGEVVQHLTTNLHKILPALYKCSSSKGSKKSSFSSNKRPTTNRIQLDRILISCNRLLRGTGAWRSHESYLNNIAVLRHLTPIQDLFTSFVPMLKQEVLTARALPCRIAAAKTLLLVMREHPMANKRNDIIEFFTQTIGAHPSCYRRRILLDIVPILLHHFSREFFVQNFMTPVLKLAKDPISNIRLQLCKTLSKIKECFVFPTDDGSLSMLEKVTKELLLTEQEMTTRQLIQQFACELSRTEADKKLCASNRARLAEEKSLWTEKEPVTEDEKSPTEPNSPESGIFDSDWMNTRRINLTRSATSSNITDSSTSNIEQKLSAFGSSSSSNLIAMGIDQRYQQRPPQPQNWRMTRPSGTPKLAIVRPQPRVTVTQRSQSPMPPNVMAPTKEDLAKNTNSNPPNSNSNSNGNNEESAKRSSKLPLSARYRNFSSTAPPTQPSSYTPPKYSNYSNKLTTTADSVPMTATEHALKKYRPRNSINITPISSQTSTSRFSTEQNRESPKRQNPTRRSTEVGLQPSASTSSLPESSASNSALVNERQMVQNSMSTSAIEGGSRASNIRRPYGLLRVQSTSSAVERKPAQMSIRVTSMS